MNTTKRKSFNVFHFPAKVKIEYTHLTAESPSYKDWIKIKWGNKYTKRLGELKLIEFKLYASSNSYLKIVRNCNAELLEIIFETSGNIPNIVLKVYFKIMESMSVFEDKVK